MMESKYDLSKPVRIGYGDKDFGPRSILDPATGELISYFMWVISRTDGAEVKNILGSEQEELRISQKSIYLCSSGSWLDVCIAAAVVKSVQGINSLIEGTCPSEEPEIGMDG